ncbi:protein kinase [Gemmatimonas phototrophica]|uniref:non-specific serine/threonine protein kinase n=1 Tax=Gemmatimonas phototrophica TaxID=1379270 RepID=A0A143BMJ1_9BACT|nr:protein kinase [Gemmatimonas phototrophica]
MNTNNAEPTSHRTVHTVPLLTTGVPGLDEVLGGGLPALSFNLIAGGPGSGKTTMAMQMLFATATVDRPGLFITLLGETSLKMLRYQQCFDFFDPTAVGSRVHFLNLSEEALDGDLDAVLARIVHDVETLRPGLVVVDSFRSLVRTAEHEMPDGQIERFVQRLALHLTTWNITSILIGEYQHQELRNPVFTVADGIFWLTQDVDRNSVVRKLQVVKSRGVQHMPGLHTLKITAAGVQVFPRVPIQRTTTHTLGGPRLSSGINGLDALMGGGIPAGDSLVLAGPTGSGKTTFAMQFVLAGLLAGESAVVAVFEERPDVYLARAARFGPAFVDAVASDRLRIIYLRPLDLSVDETLQEIREAVAAIGASRVVIDSINGFEMALAPTFREDFRESLYRLIGTLTSLGVTMYSTVEIEAQDQATLTGYRVSFLTDIILSQRYVEIEGELRKALLIVKMRGSDHSRAFRLYESTEAGITMGETFGEYDAIVTGVPKRSLRAGP